VVTLIVPVTTTLLPENTLSLITVPMAPFQTATLQPGTGLLPEQLQAYQEEQQA
jgi:hypothetical protein